MGKDIDLLLSSSPEVVREKLLPLLADICGMWSFAKVCERMSQYADCKREKRKELAETLVCLSDNWQRCKPVENVPQWNGYAESENRYWNEPQEAYFEYQDEQERAKEQKEWESKLPLSRVQVEWLQRWAEEPQPVEEAPEPVGGGVASGADHYSLNWDKEQLQTIYERLRDNGYIAQETTFGQWQYVCTGRGGNEPHTAIMWLKSQRELIRLCVDLFYRSDADRIWIKASRVFVLQTTGKAPNVKTMKTDLNKVGANVPKNWQTIDVLLNV